VNPPEGTWFRLREPSGPREFVFPKPMHWTVRLYGRTLDFRCWLHEHGLGVLNVVMDPLVFAARRLSERHDEKW